MRSTDADPYLPTPFQESNAILLAGMVANEKDTRAVDVLYELLEDMTPGELDRLARAANHLATLAASASRVKRELPV